MAGYDATYRNYQITDGLTRILRDELTEAFQAAAKPIIDSAVEKALASMKVGIESLMDPAMNREIIHAIIEDKRSK